MVIYIKSIFKFRRKGEKKYTIPQQISHMKSNGIAFHIIDSETAKKFITENTYYFKIKSFAKNYEKFPKGKNKGKYINLDFAHLKELSTLDMHFRNAILDISLYIEHSMRTQLNRDFSNNEEEDGYEIVNEFLNENEHIKEMLTKKAETSSPYIIDLMQKYDGKYALWNLMELLSFGDFNKLYKKYYNKHGWVLDIKNYLFLVKSLRNAAAHNNCLLNNLRKINYNNFKPNRKLNLIVSKINGVSPESRTRKMQHPVIHDFVALLVVADMVINSNDARAHMANDLKKLMDRFNKRIEYFQKNNVILSYIKFLQIIVDEFSKRLYNDCVDQKH